ncbi:MAG: alpha/beta hydrolase [Fimbriimonadaceae bacterium]|nr:alpha/beta hydrolase [Fimbriimonadaceae bacterium]
MQSDTRLVLMPGLGADHRLFVEQTRRFPDAHTCEWITPHPDENLRTYAARWAATQDWEKPTLLVGFAFGAMVALEALEHCPQARASARGVVIISGCRSGAAVSEAFRRQVAMSRMVPHAILRQGLLCFAERFSERDDLADGHRRLLKDMATEIDIDLFRWSTAACAEWDYRGPVELSKEVPVFQIHGERDQVVPLVPGDPDTVLPNAGHLIQFTHAGEVNAYIARCAKQVGARVAVKSVV